MIKRKITNKYIGNKGERKVIRYLKRHFYKVITHNYSTKCGEIDIIAKKNNVICFIEVKTRKYNTKFLPRTAVNYKKQTHIKRTAEIFLRNYKKDYQAVRYDIAEVYYDDSGRFIKYKINYLDDIF